MSEQAEQSDCVIIQLADVKSFVVGQARPPSVKVITANGFYVAVVPIEGGVVSGNVAFNAEGSAAKEIVNWIIALQMRRIGYSPSSLTGPDWIWFDYHRDHDPSQESGVTPLPTEEGGGVSDVA